MELENIIFVYYLDDSLIDQSSLISFFRIQNQKLFNKEFDELSYELSDGNRDSFKNVKFTPKNLDKFFETMNKSVNKGFQLSTYLDGFQYKSTDFLFTVDLNCQLVIDEYPPRSLRIVVDKSSLENKDYEKWILRFFVEVAQFLFQSGLTIKYGFTFMMERNKAPLFFVSGIGSETLSSEEEKFCNAWRRDRKSLDTKIWMPFYGNIISKSHLKPNVQFDDFISLVGNQNSLRLNDEVLFFSLSDEEIRFGEVSSTTNKKLEKYLNW